MADDVQAFAGYYRQSWHFIQKAVDEIGSETDIDPQLRSSIPVRQPPIEATIRYRVIGMPAAREYIW
jgi:hypothetical protein